MDFHLYRLWKVLTVSRSVMSDSLQPEWTVDHQAPLSMGFSRQEYWSGLPFFSPRDLPDPGIEPRFPALQIFFWGGEVELFFFIYFLIEG